MDSPTPPPPPSTAKQNVLNSSTGAALKQNRTNDSDNLPSSSDQSNEPVVGNEQARKPSNGLETTSRFKLKSKTRSDCKTRSAFFSRGCAA